MKKKYEKPIFVFESFSLDTSIAGGCEVKTNTPSLGQCGYAAPADRHAQVIFVTEDVCTTVAPDGHNGICYHTFEANNLFNS